MGMFFIVVRIVKICFGGQWAVTYVSRSKVGKGPLALKARAKRSSGVVSTSKTESSAQEKIIRRAAA